MNIIRDNYPEITEQIGDPVSEEERRRLFERYHWVAGFCAGKRVLEVACGTGQGLSFVLSVSRGATGTGIDASEENLAIARKHFANSLTLHCMDAHSLSFNDASFDVVIMLEALYFLNDPEKFLGEARRVLSSGGILLLTVNNRDMFNFSPSTYGRNYYGVPDIVQLLKKQNFEVEVWGGFAVPRSELRQSALGIIKGIATSLGLLPKTKKGRRFLKTIMYGARTPLEADIPRQYPPLSITKLPPTKRDTTHKILYVKANCQSASAIHP